MNQNQNVRGDDTNRQSHGDQFDVATIVVRVTDVNDHAPEFRLGSCYPLAVPENCEPAVVHTVVATDLDEGANGDITYTITGKFGILHYWINPLEITYTLCFCFCLCYLGGNFGNKFGIDARSGQLTARKLDRETHARFHLQIMAHDQGNPIMYHGTCNITVTVEDENDNDPRFELAKYMATVAEDVPVGTSVLTVRATDADQGVNARLVYSLSNETHWLFSIDNRSGVITTAG